MGGGNGGYIYLWDTNEPAEEVRGHRKMDCLNTYSLFLSLLRHFDWKVSSKVLKILTKPRGNCKIPFIPEYQGLDFLFLDFILEYFVKLVEVSLIFLTIKVY